MKTALIAEIVDTYSHFLRMAGLYETFDMKKYREFLAGLSDSKIVSLHKEIMQYWKIESEQMLTKVKQTEGKLRWMEERFVSDAEKAQASKFLNF